MNLKITYYTKEVYGRPLEYPADPTQAKALELMTGRKTFDSSVKEGLGLLGFTFEEVLAPKE